MRRAIGICAPFVAAILLAGCSSQPSYYTTQLDTSGGLGPGDAITHASATIGHVTSVTPISDGDSEIAFEVDGSHADEIHYDSIMTLNNLGAAPSLDVMNVDAMSHSAPSGTRLDGASSMNEVQMFMTARGPGSFAQALGKVANMGSSTAPPPSPSTVQMTQMLAQISQQTLATAVAVAPPTQGTDRPGQARVARRRTTTDAQRQIRAGRTAARVDGQHDGWNHRAG